MMHQEAAGMIIEIPKLRDEGEWFRGEEPAAILDLQEPSILFSEPVGYHLHARVVSGQLIVKGEVRVRVRIQCGRCAEFYSTIIREPAFLRVYEITGTTETVDVGPDIREDILLRLPNFPLCSPDCKGLCPQCGANLNEGTCDCRPPVDNRWGALDKLKLG
jgi:uncharacterized protein